MIRALTSGLAAAGMDVSVATTDDDGAGRRAPGPEAGFDPAVSIFCFARSLHFYTVSTGLGIWLRRHVADYDVIHLHSLFSFPATMAARCAQRHRVPYVVRPLGTLNRWGMTRRRGLKQISLALLERNILRRAAWVHFSSEQERREAEQIMPGMASRVIPNPVSVPEIFNGERNYAGSPQVILSLSRIDAVKGLDILLRAYAGLRRKMPGLRLQIAGNGDAALTADLRKLARALSVEDGVEWSGHLQGGDKEAAYRKATVFVLASHSENFGLAAVEALARAVPVVVTRGVGVHEEIQKADAGVVATPGDSGLEDALRRVLTDVALRTRIGRNGKELAAGKYSTAAIAETLRKEYAELAGV